MHFILFTSLTDLGVYLLQTESTDTTLYNLRVKFEPENS